ncbi:MAG: NAD-dependent epimerase/dehydratase family protein [Candidatus Omnitrophica bacterium]|nr:NAD-dependent epimerase/dehydratase family protein [Candidatus Omnitrophota bacterium]MDD5671483.1 NAD-dependent epimerase/dehydratase family protein [Candidatus Omnitrophota bacterium]
MTGYPGWLTNRFLETLEDYSMPFDSIRCLTERRCDPPVVKCVPAETVTGNLLDPAALDRATRNQDIVMHAAGVLHVKRIGDFYKINRDGTAKLLEASVRNGVRRFVYISTNAAQGFCQGRGHELDESGPCHPESHYGKSKRQAEEAVQFYGETGKIETVILRPAMFYGPPVPVRHLEIFRKIRKGFFYVFGTGDYLRSITYIDNLIQGIHLAIQKPEAVGQTYYIADREIPTLNDIVRSIAHAMGTEVKIIRLPEWMAYGARWLDETIAACNRYWMLPHIVGESCKNIACRITKAEKELGYNPTVSFREGYVKTIAWCREQGLL